jgi:predicted house-cleaning noncanonical NTP pyrophosphatase (MazG superfamily)
MKIKKFNEMSEFGEHDQTIMKYETLKSNICRNLKSPRFEDLGVISIALIKNNELKDIIDKYSQGSYVRAIDKKAKEEICKIINNYDIREVHNLIDIFKNIIPQKWLKNGNYTIEQNDNADWILIKKY